MGGHTGLSQKVQLKSTGCGAVINYFDDVLAATNEGHNVA
jgi:hypothetical protein